MPGFDVCRGCRYFLLPNLRLTIQPLFISVDLGHRPTPGQSEGRTLCGKESSHVQHIRHLPGEALTDGFHLVVDALKANDVDTIYGLVGIPITDLARIAQASGIRYIGFPARDLRRQCRGRRRVPHPAARRVPDESGPGFLNGLAALANATTNCFPMIQISGSSKRAMVDLQRGDYEDLDQLSAARPFAKAAYRIGRVEDIGRGVARAIRTAVSGRPGRCLPRHPRRGAGPGHGGLRRRPTPFGGSSTPLPASCRHRRRSIARWTCWRGPGDR